jgi:N-acetyl-anhydromuramyl-L-alanine amidase AmpD
VTPVPWLAQVLRDAGLQVVEHTNWKVRARPGIWRPEYGVIHATAAPARQPDITQVRLVRDGHSQLSGPIANACIDRAGTWHILSGGKCNSTQTGWAGPWKGHGNSGALSTEACNNNGRTGEPFETWPAHQYQSYVTGWAAWCRRLGWGPARLVGHKEHNPGNKTDPTFDMGRFRADVGRLLGQAPPPAPPADDWKGKVLAMLTTLRLGTENRDVKRAQALLNIFGYGLKEDGDYGPITKGAVESFQTRYGLDRDGVVGPNTWRALLSH